MSAESLTLAGTVILTGFVVVFLALSILIGAVLLMGKIMARFNQPKASAPPPPAPKSPAPAPKAAVAATAPAAQGDEVIAVISAAVGAYMEQTAPGIPYAVTGITPASRARDSRPVWGFAGMRQNTEPF